MCLRGARSSCGKPQLAASDISLVVSEARLLYLHVVVYLFSVVLSLIQVFSYI